MHWLRAFLAVSILWLAAPALAGAGPIPTPANSTIPSSITVVGTHSEGGPPVPDPAGAFTVILRDLANNPIPNATVTVDFSLATDIVLCGAPVSGQTVDCAARTVVAISDAQGVARFTIVGAAKNTGSVNDLAAPGAGLDAVQVFMDAGSGPESLGRIHIAAVLDQNGGVGGNGVDAIDLAYFSDDLGSSAIYATYRARSDYNFDEGNTGLDLSAYVKYLGEAALGIGSGDGCPGAAYCP